MKKLTTIFIVSLLFVNFYAKAYNYNTVADGTQLNEHIALNAGLKGSAQHNQILYPAAELLSLMKSKITKITFYANSSKCEGTAVIKIMSTHAQDLSNGLLDATAAVEVFSGNFSVGSSRMVFTFDVPFAYKGGNLLIDITATVSESNAGTAFYGIETELYSYGSVEGLAEEFLPKITFESLTPGMVILADGGATNGNIPAYGVYMFAEQHNQMLYPAALLQDLKGEEITQITFHSSVLAQDFTNPNETTGGYTVAVVKLKEVTEENLSGGLLNVTGATQVATRVKYEIVNYQTIFTFEEPFPYTGGNLLIDISTSIQGANGKGSTAAYYGISSPSASRCTHNYYTTFNTLYNFLPKITFTKVVNTYNLSATAGNGGTISPSGAIEVLKGESQTFTVTPNQGYEIDAVLVNGAPVELEEDNTYTFENVTADFGISATFKPINYTITYHGERGIVHANLPVYNIETETFTLAPLSLDGYTFQGWYNQEDGGELVTTIEKGTTGNLHLYAKWDLTVYHIIYHNLNGATSPNDTTYTIETPTFTLVVLADITDSVFAGWYNSSAYTTAVTEVVLGSTGDLNLWAKWQAAEGVKENTIQNVDVYAYNNTVYVVNKSQIPLKSIAVMDMTGRMVYSSTSVQNSVNLDLAKGQYIVRLLSNDAVLNTKIMIR